MLPIPVHIANANIATPTLQFAWDEWNVKSYYWDVSQAIFDRLDKLTDDASMSLTLAVGEWVVHRFDSLNRDTTPLQFLEAAWAGTVHPAYCNYTETVDDEWRGPVRGPLAVAIAIANDGLFCRDNDPEVATRACWMHRLARHVLAEATAFDAWFESTVQRLEQFHRREAASAPLSFFGNDLTSAHPVPREAFDLTLAYTSDIVSVHVDNFLKGLDADTNPYLRPADELSEFAEFKGVPYRFDTPLR